MEESKQLMQHSSLFLTWGTHCRGGASRGSSPLAGGGSSTSSGAPARVGGGVSAAALVVKAAAAAEVAAEEEVERAFEVRKDESLMSSHLVH